MKFQLRSVLEIMSGLCLDGQVQPRTAVVLINNAGATTKVSFFIIILLFVPSLR